MATAARIIPWWSWWTLLSLDAPLVALAWQHLFAQQLGWELSVEYRCLLFLAVWLSYLADRWLDGQHINIRLQHSLRHHFYSRHQNLVFVIWMIVVIFTLVIAISTLSAQLWTRCLGLLCLTALYLYISHRHSWPIKELAVSMLFPLGIGLFLPLEGIAQLGWTLAGFGVLCFFNLSFIALWEQDFDRLQEQPSLIIQSPLLGKLLTPLALLCAGCFAWLALTNIIFLPMALALCLLLGLQAMTHLSVTRRRNLADVCLLIPVVLV